MLERSSQELPQLAVIAVGAEQHPASFVNKEME
jgi:hypothetical protein